MHGVTMKISCLHVQADLRSGEEFRHQIQNARWAPTAGFYTVNNNSVAQLVSKLHSAVFLSAG